MRNTHEIKFFFLKTWYSQKDISRTRRRKESIQSDHVRVGFAFLPYVESTIDKIGEILRKRNIIV